MERNEIKKIIEALFFITDQPVSMERLVKIFDNTVSQRTIIELVDELRNDYAEKSSPLQLKQVAGGYQFATRPEYSQWVKKLFKDRVTLRLSSSALETLAIIAYKQPITRAEIEGIRGVETISVLEKLLERKLVRIAGRKETVGRPLLYGTTGDFLKYFGLVGMSDLPVIDEFSEKSADSQETQSESGEYGQETLPEHRDTGEETRTQEEEQETDPASEEKSSEQ